MSGYTLNGVAGRIRDLENKTNGGYYVALCWLAMNRNSGKGAKKILESKIFGQDKPTSTFRNAWRIAEKSFSEGFHTGCRQQVAELELEEAVKIAVERLEAHKSALKVSNMKDYEDVCKYASVETIPAAAPEETTEAETTDTADKPEGEAPTNGAPVDNDNVDVVANIKTAIEALSMEQAEELAGWLAERLELAREHLAKAA